MAGDAADFDRLFASFDELRQLPPPERQARLDDLARRDPATARELEQLLRMHDRDGDALAAPEQALSPQLVAAAFAAVADDPAPPPPTAIGPYRLLRLLGRGGMGEVHLAERTGADFRQQVAIKLLRQDFAADRLVERFRTERRILAGLRHPNIGALLDGGTTDDGRPYVVMEFVDGRDLVTWCGERRLDLQARLRLFLHVLAAVDHAHRNLVVHRDLKPGNILVTQDGVPKLLDFGIAKLIDDDDAAGAADAARTGGATLLLTPEYCSPEQVRGEAITTATDVYALGAILYELLTGHRAQQPTTRSLTELAAVVCERSPVPPSAAAAAPSAAAPAGLSPRQLAHRLRGDLDTIVACAMRKEPDRRYGRAEALADDLRRHLDGLPVRARPDTLAYRTQKFVRRHRLPVAAALLLLLFSAVFVRQTLQQNDVIRRERDDAEAARGEADARRRQAEAARANAEAQRNAASAIADFLVDLYQMAEPDAERANQLRARQLLDRGRARIAGDLAAAPLQRALLQTAMARAYLNLGLPDDAEPLLRDAAPVLDADTADPVERADLHHFQGQLAALRGQFDAAVAALQRSIADRPDDSTGARLHRLRSRMLLASLLREAGRLDDGDEQLRRGSADLEPIAAEYPRTAADLRTAQAALLRERGHYDESLQQLTAAQDLMSRTFGPDHPTMANILREFGDTYKEAGRLDDGRLVLEQALALDRRIGGDDNPDVDTDLFQLAMLEMDAGTYDRAERLLDEVLRRDRARYGNDHAYTALDLGQLASLLVRRGDADERAEQLYREAIDIQRRVLPPDHPELATTLSNYGSLLQRANRLDEAWANCQEALALRLRVYGNDHPMTLSSQQQAAVIAYARDDIPDAEAQFRAVLESRQRTLGDHPQTAGSMFSVATVVASQGRVAEAEQLLTDAIAMYRRTLPPLHIDLARPLYALGRMRLGQRDPAAAEPLLREALQCRAQLTAGAEDLVRCQVALAETLMQLRRVDEARTLLQQALAAAQQEDPDGRGQRALTQAVQRLEQSADRAMLDGAGTGAASPTDK